MKEIVANDFINHTAAGAVPTNVEGLKQFVKMLHTGFSDFHVDIHEQVGENDIIATRKNYTSNTYRRNNGTSSYR